jgi:hypothetical protein
MKVRQQSDTLPARFILTVTAFAVGATAIGVGAAWLLQGARHRDLGGGPLSGSAEPSPPPEMNAVEMDLFAAPLAPPAPSRPTVDLESYGWVDRDTGVIRIPMSRAFDLYLESRGEPP